jgi:tRNA (guanine37-N1)-methyltransferase
MRFSVISIFPDMIRNFIQFGLIARATKDKLIGVDVYDLREFTTDKHRKVDDRPFGGGAGMVMKPEPLFNAIDFVKGRQAGRVILFSAYGRPLSQKKVGQLAAYSHLILVCGRYEGVDQRVIEERVDEEISLGEYVLMGGEVAAEAVIESVSRIIDGVVGNPESVQTDSFYTENQLAFPQYTQPRDFRGLAVPDVLLSGNHKEITEWRIKNQKRRRA